MKNEPATIRPAGTSSQNEKLIGEEMGSFPSKIKPFLISVILILHLPLSVFGAAITDIRFWSAPDHTRVVIDLTESVQYESSYQENPPQCQVELAGITSLPKKKELEVKDKYLLKKRFYEVCFE